MLSNSGFNKTVDILGKSMSALSLRRQVIANNLANAETPNFKRSEVSFESQLKRALQSENTLPSLAGTITNPKHISFYESMDYRSVKPRVSLDYLTTAKSNGNNVVVERELNDSTKNQMLYEMMTSVLSHQFRSVNIVLS